MEPLSTLCVLIGTLIIVVRAPMIFAPRATLRFSRRLIASNARIRAIGLVMAPWALALVVFARGGGLVVGILQALGWLFVAATLWLLVGPASYGRVVRGWLGFFEDSADIAVVRILGLFAVGIGVAVIYVGLYAV